MLSSNRLDITIVDANILIVDDDPSIVLLLTRLLESENYRHIQSTGDPRQVLELCRRNAFDLILLDLTMPYLDGYQVIKSLQTAFTELPPILLLTGRSEKEQRQQAMKTGVTDVIVKPFDPDELFMRVKKILEMAYEKHNIH